MQKSNRTEGGFSLLEALFALTAFLLLTAILLLLMKQSALYSINEQALKDQEVYLFFQQLEIEMLQAESVTVLANQLALKKRSGAVVTYEKYGSFVRRRVNGSGHEIVLQHISAIQYSSVSEGVVIKVVGDEQTIMKRISLIGKARSDNSGTE